MTQTVNQPIQKAYLKASAEQVLKLVQAWKPGRNNRKIIHDIRIGIKRIHTIAKLNEDQTRTYYNKEIRPFFKSCGKVRDLQHSISYLQQRGKDHKTTARIRKKLKAHIISLQDQLPVFQKQFKLGVRHISAHLMVFDPEIFLDRELTLIRYRISKRISRTSLHELRKRSKDILNIADMQRFASIALPLGSKQQLGRIQKEIGEWHDLSRIQKILKKEGKHFRSLSKLERGERERLKQYLSHVKLPER